MTKMNHRKPEERIKQLEKAILRLERLTRDCFELAKAYWVNGNRDASKYRKMENETAEKIAQCIAEVIYEDREGRVFVAPRYRGTGTFKEKPGEGTHYNESSEDSKRMKINKFASDFGRLAVKNSAGVIIVPPNQFMPVAFWNYHLYEKPIEIQIAAGVTIPLEFSGFSGWTAQHGFLGHGVEKTASPIFGFHFKLTDSSAPIAEFQHGLLHFCLPRNTPRSKVTEAFKDAFYNDSNYFYRGAQQDVSKEEKHPFPVIYGTNDLPESDRKTAERVGEAIFSTLFYSNFKRHGLADWSDLLKLGIEINDSDGEKHDDLPKLVHRSLTEAAEYLFSEYLKFAPKEEESNLAFDHYYAFLLNPSLNFSKNEKMKDSAIGTVNVYTDEPIPPLLAALIRKHIESIYHFLREIEDWEEATIEGADSAFVRMNEAMGHEVSKVYDTAYTLLSTNQIAGNTIINDIVRMTLQYGLLWGESSSASIPPDAQIWSKGGLSVLQDKYVSCLARESWRLFLVSEVLRGINSDELNASLDIIQPIWEFNISNFVRYNEQIFLEIEPSLMQHRHREKLSRGIYRWATAVTSNLWKHFVLQLAEIDKPLKTMLIKDRFEIVNKFIHNIKYYDWQMLPIITFYSEKEGCTISIENSCCKRKHKAHELRGTFLVMLLAGQEIWKLQGLKCSLMEVRKHSRFEYDDSKRLWISNLYIPHILLNHWENPL
ncbi:MAG: hypothetical protein JJE30_11125 [Desulfuromonadales bacterium]|nr:hypothetical protein [Desulfuromonadales bacterium]